MSNQCGSLAESVSAYDTCNEYLSFFVSVSLILIDLIFDVFYAYRDVNINSKILY